MLQPESQPVRKVLFCQPLHDDEIMKKLVLDKKSQSSKWKMPIALNLDASGLWHSPRLQEIQHRQEAIAYCLTTTCIRQEAIAHSLTTTCISEASSPPPTNKQRTKMACLALFSSFCAIGSESLLWSNFHQTVKQALFEVTSIANLWAVLSRMWSVFPLSCSFLVVPRNYRLSTPKSGFLGICAPLQWSSEDVSSQIEVKFEEKI